MAGRGEMARGASAGSISDATRVGRRADPSRGWAVLVLATLCLAFVPDAESAVIVAPIPKIHAVKSVFRVGVHDRLLLKSLELYGIENLRRTVSCDRCLRLPTKMRMTHPTPSSTLYEGVNWVLEPGRSVLISVLRPGQIGRFVRLAAKVGAKPELIFSASGCLASFGRVERCPRNTVAPTPGSAVPQAPQVGSDTPTGTSQPTLTVTGAGAGSGTVTGGGISCPGVCSKSFPTGTAVSLTAAAASGSTFAGWSGGCTGTGPCKLTMTADQSVTAAFALAPHQLTVVPAGTGSGTVTGGGISCPATCSKSLPSGTAVSLTATPASGSTFAGWSGGCTGTGACNLTPTADQSVTATFTLVPHQLTVTAAGTGSGTITGGGLACPPTCSGSYASGTAVSLTAAATNGGTFAGWGGGCTGTGACNVTMSSDQTVTATFTAAPPPPAFYVHHVYGTCRDGACGLKVHTAPSLSSPVTHVILDGTEVDVVCQATGDLVSNGHAASAVWDRQTDGWWVSDFYVDTPNIGTWSPPIPQC